MLTLISRSGAPPSRPSPGPLEMLEGCHVRIRHFMQLGRNLAQAPAASPAEIAEAAGAIFRYFSDALPLHEADENLTLFPRFRNASIAAPLREAAKAMVEQHHAINELIAALLEVCDGIRREPVLLPNLACRLHYVTSALDRIFEAHLNMEETVLFPALREFPAEELEAMAQEMQQRRRPQGTIHLVR
jgi:hemerythrin-like domain-containing protein